MKYLIKNFIKIGIKYYILLKQNNLKKTER